ncbi:unnamed protein product [Urochloa decumbens]|uniref:RING-type E3 ubiquitin transferase n=1 Tax=Urochloa decumbens TaxID=240449 RepID=A0ABC9DGU0_9POAL
MAGYLPPGFAYFTPPPSRWAVSPPPPPPPRFHQASPTSRDNRPSSPGGVIAGVAISVGVFLLVLTFVCSLCQGYRNSRANAASEAAAATAAAAFAAHAARRRALSPPVAWDDNENDEQRLRSRSASNDGRPRRVSPAAGLPSFTYNRSVRHNVTGGGGGEEAASCSVCLGAFQTGETVRLLPVCLHLYHVECIDPWLDAHSTCPICRSGTDPGMDGSLLPPV